ncbi:two-component sensor histidine kinase [Acinetobacter defluvii]|uniref:ATP-binding protein n=1 Tax=Acinetobacter defluvii TaxID=1871111 RepID=UPI0014902A04|nr:ATP-binding protein [Acinetobacter defluvii]NNP72386.1 two-component sensor histidine kinase [Acinetobacter defluvii]
MKQKQHYSLRRRLILYVSLFSVLMGCVLIFTAYKISLHETTEILDEQMVYLAERVAKNARPLESEFNHQKRYHEEDLFIDVWAYSERKDLSHADHYLVEPKTKASFYTQDTEHGTWIAYVLPTEKYQIQISQQFQVREKLAFELAGTMFLPYVLIMPFALFALVFIIRRSLKPLDEFKSELSLRDPNSLSSIQSSHYPEELVPTINEMNHLFERISLAQQEQRQFVADAAHELRTPITALNLQTKILMSQFPDDPNLLNLSKGLARMQHLVTQLLALAKQDASLKYERLTTTFQLNDVAFNCVEQLLNLAVQKDIDLGFLRNDPVQMVSIEQSVHSIIFNLIDNAIKYTPDMGVINISVFEDGQGSAFIQIEDSGAGIEPELYDKVLKRFYRVHHHLEVGSGLGLSIVEKAVQHLGGHIQFSRSEELGGLQVLVKLPMQLSDQ